MNVILRSTSKVVTLIVNGAEVPARIWEGETERGVKCHAYITRIAVGFDQDSSQFEAELQEHIPPSTEIANIPLRMII